MWPVVHSKSEAFRTLQSWTLDACYDSHDFPVRRKKRERAERTGGAFARAFHICGSDDKKQHLPPPPPFVAPNGECHTLEHRETLAHREGSSSSVNF